MRLFPAIDILGGRSVRLLKGDYGQVTDYGSDPVRVALDWVERGAGFLHVVDLDGARDGSRANRDLILAMASECSVPIQVGGGIRDLDGIGELLGAGVSRVVIGTSAIRDPELLREALGSFGSSRIVVSVDTRDGMVSVGGWMEDSGLPVVEAVRELSDRGVKSFLHTSIETDGTLEGPDLDQLELVSSATDGTIIASGGIGGLADLVDLRKRAAGNVEGVVVGKALYERRFTIAEAEEALEPE